MTAAAGSSTHPDCVTPGVRELEFVCPLCRQSLQVKNEVYHCSPCGRDYPVFHGIPDFRTYRDPFLGRKDDLARSERILEVMDRYELPDLLEYYWGLSDFTPEYLWRRYIAAELRSEERGSRFLEQPGQRPHGSDGRLLDAGCGTGGVLLAASRRGFVPTGADIAMRWLQVARRRFMDANIEEPALVCCCADHLPFRDETFDRVSCTDTLEFARDQERVMSECARIVRRSGGVFVGTANRYSILKDPYSSLWGVGFLPRRWQAPWVRWRRGAHYENLRLLSLRQLRRLTRRYFRRVTIIPTQPPVSDNLPRRYRVLLGIYRQISRAAPVRGLLTTIVPHWDASLADPVREDA